VEKMRGSGWKLALLLCVAVVLTLSLYSDELSSGMVADYFAEGLKAQKQGNYFAALTAYKKAMLVEPENEEYAKYILNNIGLLLMYQGDIQGAGYYFQEALRIDPAYRPAQLNLGLVLDRKGDKLIALQYWIDILELEIEQMKPKAFILQELPEE